MKSVIAVFDIGKTNKKIFLFDKDFNVVFRESIRFDEIKDEDDYPCDDIDSIEYWIRNEIKKIREIGQFKIKAINFSTHGATIVFLNKKGQRIAPIYNYLKPLDIRDFEFLYESNEGVEEFSRKTASPAYGMLNVGIQMLFIKYKKPDLWNQVQTILHYPQYLSYLFTNKITADYTSIGAHTALWNYDTMQYHDWLKKENIHLPKPTNGKQAKVTNINNELIAVGSGLHDSSSSIIPLLEKEKDNKFVLLSTGTWIIAMNPFSSEVLTQHQLKNNCLCFLTPEKQQVKSSMQFLGKIHEVYLEIFADYFQTHLDTHLDLELNISLCERLTSENKRIFLEEGIDTDFTGKPELIKNFYTYEEAYYQLIFEICKKVVLGIELIMDKDIDIPNIYISGGFIKNDVFIKFLELFKKDVKIKISDAKNESALGAALLMKEYL